MPDFCRVPDAYPKPCFFAETSFRALLYSGQDFAGGETARAVRKAFADLDRYLDDSPFRRRELWQSWCQMRQWVVGFDPPSDPASPDEVTHKDLLALWDAYAAHGRRAQVGTRPPVRPADFTEGWLRARLDALRPVQNRAEEALREFTHGVIYAVRFKEEDLPHLGYESAPGLYSRVSIPPSRIEARARISLEIAAHDPDYATLGLATEGKLRALQGDGVVGRLERNHLSR
jgi:hypothetical protein